MRSRSLIAVVCGAVAALTLGVGTASATPSLSVDTAACTNANSTLAADQFKLSTDQTTRDNTLTKIPDEANPGQFIANPAYTVAVDKVTADNVKIAADQAAVTAACGTGSNSGTFANCADAHAAGVYDIPSSDARYRTWLDANRNGIACERNESSGSNSGGSDNGSTSCTDAKNAQNDAFTRLEDSIRHLNDVDAQVSRNSNGSGNVSQSDQQLVRNASRDENVLQQDWQRARNHRRDVCRDNGGNGTTTVIVQPAPAGTTYVNIPPPVNTPAPPTFLGSSSGSGVVSSTPKGAPPTGDGSLSALVG
ncbi:MAG: hypothetical protein JWO67_3201 [Streptosporangiaceae bacterium]|nr:hypothetical protein [Streptosporangiaceae bacterium]